MRESELASLALQAEEEEFILEMVWRGGIQALFLHSHSLNKLM